MRCIAYARDKIDAATKRNADCLAALGLLWVTAQVFLHAVTSLLRKFVAVSSKRRLQIVLLNMDDAFEA